MVQNSDKTDLFYCILSQEDQDAMEVDLDKDEVVRAEGDEQSGERLLTEYAASVKTKKRVGLDLCIWYFLK